MDGLQKPIYVCGIYELVASSGERLPKNSVGSPVWQHRGLFIDIELAGFRIATSVLPLSVAS